MKIVHCILSLNVGGAETMLIDIVNEQVKTQEVTVVIVNDSFQTALVEKIDKKVQVIFVGRQPMSRSFFPLIKFNWILLRLRPHVIHVHNSSLPAIINPLLSYKLFMTVHALRVPLRHARRVACLFAISDAVKEDVLNRGNFRIFTIPNGINIDKIEKRGTELIAENRRMRIVQVARLESSKKGQDVLINAIANLMERGITGVEVDFIGTGKDEALLKQLAEKLGVTDKIHFLGMRDRQYIYSHLKDYDLMCHPSRYEGFGLTVAEGIAAMLPILVSDDGGPYEIIMKGELGHVFKMGNAVDCANKIEYIFKNYGEALQLTQPAYLHVEKNYSVIRMVTEYIEGYKSALKI